MVNPYLAPAMLLASERSARLRAEAAATRSARRLRSRSARLESLRRLLAGATGSAWPTSAPVPALRDYPYAAA